MDGYIGGARGDDELPMAKWSLQRHGFSLMVLVPVFLVWLLWQVIGLFLNMFILTQQSWYSAYLQRI